MPSVTIRNVPDGTRDELSARAARSGRSLQEYLRQALIELADRPSPEDWAARARERVQRLGTTFSADEILEHLHADRR